MNRTGFNICVRGICGENKSTLGARLGHPLIGAKRHIERLFKVKLNG